MATDGRPLTGSPPPDPAAAEEPRDGEEGDDGDGGGGGLQVPRPILIVAIVVIALGLVSCALGGLRGAIDGPPDPNDISIDFDELVDPQPIPANELGLTGVNGGTCNRFGAIVQVSGTCRITVEARILPQRELNVRVDAGTAVVVVAQEVRGDLEVSDPEDFFPGQVFDVSGGGTNDIQAFVDCGAGGCNLRVLQ